MKIRFAAALATIAFSPAAWAKSPMVATDISPVHSLVAQVMDGVSTPTLIIDPGASPHGYALRPSQAQALEKADIVFRTSDELTPWLIDSLATLSGSAQQVELMQVEGTIVLEQRTGDNFDPHTHDDHDDHSDHDDHGHEHDEHDHDHDHAYDPHGWLDPKNAIVWLDTIAAELSALDPDNATTYAANAAKSKAELNALIEEVSNALAPLHDLRFVVFHDAYQYFESRFGVTTTGAISMSDAKDPGPAHLAALRDRITEMGVTCLFTEPQFNPAMIDTIRGQRDLQVAVIDPLGATLQPGATLYSQLLRDMAQALQSCRTD
ncbi:zinc ABC transporter substrate-binding protein [Pontibaca salina]|uniref:High-affinity zinc uptake system protein ZnuA n=1 Tax=Pontibaca salina TaxID=2795731 RepID=A0A934M0E2_9RHOB|nr:zinc ABC transporter substrate-binding protein [Pontibaca salina]MBI6629920.1 zinc ABC transporter substrate-binding protein [Pontibaca salina]